MLCINIKLLMSDRQTDWRSTTSINTVSIQLSCRNCSGGPQPGGYCLPIAQKCR